MTKPTQKPLVRIFCLDDKFEAKMFLRMFFDGISSLQIAPGKHVFIEDVDVYIANVTTTKVAFEVIKDNPKFDIWTLDYNLKPGDITGLEFLKQVLEKFPEKVPYYVDMHSGSFVDANEMRKVFDDWKSRQEQK